MNLNDKSFNKAIVKLNAFNRFRPIYFEPKNLSNCKHLIEIEAISLKTNSFFKITFIYLLTTYSTVEINKV